jgi:C1A family cysteine protease
MIPPEITTSQRTTRRLGWRPDLPDHRDRWLLAAALPAKLPTHTENYLGHRAIPIYDQGNLGSCTANAVLRAYRIAIRRTVGGLHDFDGSRLAHYFWTRVIDGSEDYDAGAYIRDAMKVLTKVGVAPEKLWPYLIARFAEAPPPPVIEAAARRLRVEYLRVDQTATGIKQALAARHPVVFGTSVFASMVDAMENTGMVPVPGPNESVLGGHAMEIEDYDDVGFSEPMYLAAGSWGPHTGLGGPGARAILDQMRSRYDVTLLGGYVLFPQRVLHDWDIAGDFWTVTAAA